MQEKNIQDLIHSLEIPIVRDLELENCWKYNMYSEELERTLSYYSKNSLFSTYLKEQISQLIHQQYLVIVGKTISVPVRSIYTTINEVSRNNVSRRKLKNISKNVGFDVYHIHFGQSSFQIENWANHAKKDNLHSQQNLNTELIYENLISSLSKKNKTGEWIVYSNQNDSIQFWCIWLHKINDNKLIDLILKSNIGNI